MTFSGRIGFGDKVTGKIVVLGEAGESLGSHMLDLDLSGKILVSLSSMEREALEKAGFLGIAGLVVPSIHFRDFVRLQSANEFPVLVLTKFGSIKLGSELCAKLMKLSGEKGILDGADKKLTV